jgi:hypothetical protein
MKGLDWILFILLAVGGALEGFAVGLPEEDAKYRFLAILGTVPIATASVLACVRLYMALPFWLALPAGIAVLCAGVTVVYVIVGKILPSKGKPSEWSR